MTEKPSVLVPIRVLGGESVPERVPELLADAHVVLLGYHSIPEQTAPGQARMQFEERATRRLDEYQEMFEKAGSTVERRLVFTHDKGKTVERIMTEHGCIAVLTLNSTGPIEDVLVAVGDATETDRVASLVSGLFGDRDVSVTLYHVEDEEVDGGRSDEGFLDELVEKLDASGLDRSRIEVRIETEERYLDAVIDTAEDFDVVVMGATHPSISTFISGTPADQVASRFPGPVLVVQQRNTEEEE